MSTRDAVVAALDGQVVGAAPHQLTLNATKVPPKLPQAGACWPLVESWDPVTPGLFATSWRVVLVLPTELARAAETADAVAVPTALLLQAAGWVERIEPYELQVQQGASRPALVFTITPDA